MLVSIRFVLALVFLLAGLGKLIDLEGSRRALAEFGVPRGMSRVAGTALPLVELTIAAALLVDPSGRYGAVGALVLLTLFTGAIVRVLSRGSTPECHCFGQLHSEPVDVSTALRNVVLAGLAIAVVVAGPGPGIPGGLERLSAGRVVLGAAALIVIVLVVATTARWGGSPWLRRLLRSKLGRSASVGLVAGAAAPGFDLEPIRGSHRTLAELLDAARPVVLVFATTGCGSCGEVFALLGSWQDSLAGAVTLAAIVAGRAGDVRRLAAEHDLKSALADEPGATLARYGLVRTPSAVLIDTDGRTVGPAVEGAPAIEALVRKAIRRAPTSEFVVGSR